MIDVDAGDKPELLYPEAEKELLSMGFSSTLEYVAGKPYGHELYRLSFMLLRQTRLSF